MHQINPAKSPPVLLLTEATNEAKRLGKPVYLFQNAQGWKWVKKLSAVPPGSLITEVVGNADDPESWNTGGC